MSAPSEMRGRLEHLAFEVAQGVSGKTGDAFFQSLARDLAHALEADFVIVGALQPGSSTIHTLAAYKDQAEPAGFEYDLAGTPCAKVAGGQTVSYATGVQKLFPQDSKLAELGAEGYTGAPMIDSKGQCTGVVCALTRGTLHAPEIAEALLEVFASRAASELERTSYEEALARLERDYSCLAGKPEPAGPIPKSLRDAERQHILRILDSTSWIVEGSKGAARVLEMNPSTLRSMMKRLGIRRPA